MDIVTKKRYKSREDVKTIKEKLLKNMKKWKSEDEVLQICHQINICDFFEEFSVFSRLLPPFHLFIFSLNVFYVHFLLFFSSSYLFYVFSSFFFTLHSLLSFSSLWYWYSSFIQSINLWSAFPTSSFAFHSPSLLFCGVRLSVTPADKSTEKIFSYIWQRWLKYSFSSPIFIFFSSLLFQP